MTVVVFGSANADLVLNVDRHPTPGETVAAIGGTRRQAGGKGLNQAIGARRAGGHPTVFIGAVGSDVEADLVERALTAAGVETSLRRLPHAATGLAVVMVDGRAENEIVVAAGANAELDGVTEEESALLGTADVAVFQGETPRSGFRAAAAAARAAGALIVLNPSPVWLLSDEEIDVVDVLVVNETEGRLIAQQSAPHVELDDDAVTEHLRTRFRHVVLTLGSRGAVWFTSTETSDVIPAPTVPAVDTTGAGDTFCGVLAAALADDLPLDTAVRHGILAASVAVTRPGAADAIPQLSEWHADPPRGDGPRHRGRLDG